MLLNHANLARPHFNSPHGQQWLAETHYGTIPAFFLCLVVFEVCIIEFGEIVAHGKTECVPLPYFYGSLVRGERHHLIEPGARVEIQ